MTEWNLPIDDIIADYQAGMSLAYLGKKHHVAPQTIRAKLIKKGVKIESLRRRDQKGAKNSQFKDGLSRSSIERLTRRILYAANVDLYTCQRCGQTSNNYTGPFNRRVELDRHHKDENRSNNVLENLEVLCVTCHNSGKPGAAHQRMKDKNGRWI